MLRRRRFWIGFVVVVGLLLVVGYATAGIVIYNRLSSVAAKCSGGSAANSPSAFTTEKVDSEPFLMSEYEEVTFPSRDANLTLSGWYIPANEVAPADAPAVVLVHGLGGCKHSPNVLLPAGMLHKNGFQVLLVDLRDQGDSQIEDGRYAGGTEEYRDALGAWDWLVNEKGVPPERIGLFGVSLGAATVMIAAGEESRVAATWEDSGYADINVAIEAELRRNGYPTFLAPGGVLIGRLIAGDDLTALSPLRAMAKLNGRPFFITHGDADTRLSVQYAYDLAAAISANGGATIEPWIIAGSEHVRGMFDHPEEYEERLVEFFSTSLGE